MILPPFTSKEKLYRQLRSGMFFRQSNLNLYKGTKLPPADELERRVDEETQNPVGYNELEPDLQSIFIEIHKAVLDHQLVKDVIRARGNNIYRYRNVLKDPTIANDPEISELSRRLDEHLARQKIRYRDMRIAVQKKSAGNEAGALTRADVHQRSRKSSKRSIRAGSGGRERSGRGRRCNRRGSSFQHTC